MTPMKRYYEGPESSKVIKVTKEKVNYRPAENPDFTCGSCIHFKPADETRGYGYCGLVIGRVSSEGVCDLWGKEIFSSKEKIVIDTIGIGLGILSGWGSVW